MALNLTNIGVWIRSDLLALPADVGDGTNC
jgi:hypothetical protein